jgi:hypothetical protein
MKWIAALAVVEAVQALHQPVISCNMNTYMKWIAALAVVEAAQALHQPVVSCNMNI